MATRSAQQPPPAPSDAIRTALITGASSGIGRELARELAASGYDLVLVARRVERLEALARELESEHPSISVHVIGSDLSAPGAAAAIHKELEVRGISVECLVNNAGFSTNGRFCELDLAREVEMLQVNIVALVELTGLLAPAMVRRGRGRVLNISSTGAFQPAPNCTGYAASKAFVQSFSEGLAYELRNTGVTATAFCPNATNTEYAEVAGMKGAAIFKSGVAEPDYVAREARKAMERGKRVAIPGWMNRAQVRVTRFLPRTMVMRVAESMTRT